MPEYSDPLDAMTVAPDHHKVLLDNDQVRVLDTCPKPGERTPAPFALLAKLALRDELERLRQAGCNGLQLRRRPFIRVSANCSFSPEPPLAA